MVRRLGCYFKGRLRRDSRLGNGDSWPYARGLHTFFLLRAPRSSEARCVRQSAQNGFPVTWAQLFLSNRQVFLLVVFPADSESLDQTSSSSPSHSRPAPGEPCNHGQGMVRERQMGVLVRLSVCTRTCSCFCRQGTGASPSIIHVETDA